MAIFYSPYQQFINPATGVPVALGTVVTCAAGSTTPKACYADGVNANALSSPLPTTMNLNAQGFPTNGSAQVTAIVCNGNYKFFVYDSASAPVFNQDNIEVLAVSNATGIIAAASLYDTNGNEILGLPATASAINYLTIANAATGNGPTITTAGGDTNIPLNIAAKGSGAINITGNTTMTLSALAINATSATFAISQAATVGSTLSVGGALTLNTTGRVVFNNAANTFATTLKAGANSSSVTFTLPIADGTNGQHLQTNGSGVLSWS